MKEATGEANMTIITVVLIGVVATVAMFLIPNIMKTVKQKSCCTAEGGTMSGGSCMVDGSAVDISSCVGD